MKMRFTALFALCAGLFHTSFSQSLIEQKDHYSRADSLRGSLRPERTCYDVTFYELDVKVDTANRSIAGTCKIVFKALQNFQTLQIDLFANMGINSITYGGKELKYSREFNAVFVDMGATLPAGVTGELIVSYAGKPVIAKRPPWDGGFTWVYDKGGRLWVGVSCEGMGASSWWPCKDYLGDEPDSMSIICTVPKGMVCVANGSENGESENNDGTVTYKWFVNYPINNYNVSLNIGDYIHLHDEYTAQDTTTLNLDYYVISYNELRAKKQFEQVKPMLKCYEKYLGKYPFWKDGYALVETPYLGMEHQGAIGYGNQYKMGYNGIDFSRIGLEFDYIIIHESGHEWFGNSISCADIADMWIHEGFTTYTEAIYVECMYGPEIAQRYVNAKKPSVGNKNPVVGIYGVNEEGDGDMYNKGMLFLNTLRHAVNDDEKWWSAIKAFSDTVFKMKNIDYNDVVNYFSTRLNMPLGPVFEQYLKQAAIPEFEYSVKALGKGQCQVTYRWNTDVKNFSLPAYVYTSNGFVMVHATNQWQTTQVRLKKASDFKVNEDWMYIKVKRTQPVKKLKG